ncbi:hypothetical protein FAZ80_07750 [Escherichia coli K-12]|nr:hypothetical protein [Escherichia coli]RUK83043.1 hypothetical protein ELP74_13480 [Shigella boydii]THI79879.1 hypothetical protein FAZ80_07750 [Escherichia coli K-12]MBK2804827.1 hypothetical protein [Escherichia coli]MDJ1213499.1 hypothetical protein [Escherichia coli]
MKRSRLSRCHRNPQLPDAAYNALSGLHAPFFIVGKGKYKNSPKYFALQEGSKRASPRSIENYVTGGGMCG